MRFVFMFLCIFSFFDISANNIPFFSNPPDIDGKINSEEWANSLQFDLQKIKGGKPDNPTTVFLCHDNEFLYVAFRCSEKDMNSIRLLRRNPEEKDNSIWDDDCVEIFIDPFNSGNEKFYQIIVNSGGIVYDAAYGNAGWDSGLKTAVSSDDKGWTVETAIPFASFPYAPKGCELWSFNFAREKKSPSEISCLKSGEDALKSLSHFSEFGFQPEKEAFPFILKKLQDGLKMAAVFEFNNDSSDKTYKVEIPEEFVKFANPGEHIEIPYKIAEKQNSLNIKVSEGKEIIYKNTVTIYKRPPIIVVNKISNPLYKELWSQEPAGLAKNGGMYWSHLKDYNELRTFALQYGLRYIYEETFKDSAENKLMTIGAYPEIEKLADMNRKYGVKFIYRPNFKVPDAPHASAHTKTAIPFIFDPRCQKKYFQTIKDMRGMKDMIWAVFFGDELSETAITTGINLFAEKKDSYPYIRQVDKEVKKLYGGGVYGIPESMNDPNPYRWIAYRHWLNDKLIAMMKQTYVETKKISPDIYVISDDGISAQNCVYDFSQFKDVCDIITNQLYPKRNPDLDDFGFLTKYIADLSSCKEIWPCPHIEEYGYSFTPEEVLAKLSETVRSGATGFHYYLSDTIGRRTKKKYLYSEYFGAPERWQTEMAVLKEMGQMNRLKFPAPDSAIFTPMDTLRSYVGLAYPEKAFALHSFLGPNAGLWFKYTNESLLDSIKNYKVIFVADAKYLRKEAFLKLKDYVENGGTLVVLDPQAFLFTELGESLASERSELLGITETVDAKHNNLSYKSQNLSVSGLYNFNCKLRKGASAAATFEDGTPGIIHNTVGKGNVWCFAVNPLSLRIVPDNAWKNFFKEFSKSLSLKCDNDIWRFRFPDSLITPLPLPQGCCLTGNSITWRQFNPVMDANIETGGTYSYSVEPDIVKDKGGVKEVPFSKGNLTNRTSAPNAGNVSCGIGNINAWIVSWNLEKPVSIDFDLKNTYMIDRVIIFYQNFISDIKIETSTDEKNWQTFDFHKTEEDNMFPEDVRSKELKLPQKHKARFIRVSFASSKGKITLAEIEIWGSVSDNK